MPAVDLGMRHGRYVDFVVWSSTIRIAVAGDKGPSSELYRTAGYFKEGSLAAVGLILIARLKLGTRAKDVASVRLRAVPLVLSALRPARQRMPSGQASGTPQT
jgi:hypothetical protein